MHAEASPKNTTQIELERAHTIALYHLIRSRTMWDHKSFHDVMEWYHNIERCIWYPKLFQYLPKCFSVHGVENFCKVDKDHVPFTVFLPCFFGNLSKRKNHICSAPARPKPTLWLRIDVTYPIPYDSIENYTRQDFIWIQKREIS